MGKASKIQVDKRKPTRAGWATPEQETWLREQVPEFLNAKASGTKGLADFWPDTWQGWFEKWPEPLPVMLPVTDSESPQDTEKDRVLARKAVSC